MFKSNYFLQNLHLATAMVWLQFGDGNGKRGMVRTILLGEGKYATILLTIPTCSCFMEGLTVHYNQIVTLIELSHVSTIQWTVGHIHNIISISLWFTWRVLEYSSTVFDTDDFLRLSTISVVCRATTVVLTVMATTIWQMYSERGGCGCNEYKT